MFAAARSKLCSSVSAQNPRISLNTIHNYVRIKHIIWGIEMLIDHYLQK